MLYDFSKTKEILSVDKPTITKIIFNFKSYFSNDCQIKGQERKFTLDDICKLSYIFFYWEDKPDIEAIEIGLNREEYLSYPFNQFYFDLVPIIRDDFENISVQNSDKIFLNRAIFNSNFELASEYYNATKILIQSSKNSREPWLMLFPILFNLRHSIELYLKSVISLKMDNCHNLIKLYNQFKKERGITIGKQFELFLETVNMFDGGSTTFRYADNNENYEEYYIDFEHTTMIMDKFQVLIKSFGEQSN